MPVEDIFSITGRGTVATGRIETGVVLTGNEVNLIGLGAEGKKTVVRKRRSVEKTEIRKETNNKGKYGFLFSVFPTVFGSPLADFYFIFNTQRLLHRRGESASG